MIGQTDRFLQFCQGLADSLINRAGGRDSLDKHPAGYRNKTVGMQYLMVEGKGPELKSRILDFRNTCLEVVKGNAYFEDRIALRLELVEPGKTWEEYKFKGMPLAAILPILGKCEADAIASETAVLQYLNE